MLIVKGENEDMLYVNTKEHGLISATTLDKLLEKIAEYSLVFGSCTLVDSDITPQDIELARRKFGPEGM